MPLTDEELQYMSSHEWYPGETKDVRKKRLQKANAERWRRAHPNGGRDATRRWRANNPEKKDLWPSKREMGQWVKNYKESNPCSDCGGKFPACCMDFDHLPGTTKKYSVGTMVAHGHSKKNILEEIAKCQLVCANCHRIRTRDRRHR